MFGSTTPLQNVPSPSTYTAALCAALFGAILALACVPPDASESTVAPPVPGEISLGEPATSSQTRHHGQTKHVMVLENSCGIPDSAIDESYATRSFWNLSLVTEIHAGLFAFGGTGGAEIKPNLAETFSTSDGGSRYEFRLRKGLKFSDGSELTASDVKWSWERALRLSTSGSRGRDALGVIRGADRFLIGESSELAGIRVIDDRTLSVHLESPFPNFPMLLASPVAAVLKRENVETWPIQWHNKLTTQGIIASLNDDYADRYRYDDFDETNLPVGAGPFKLTKLEHYDPGATCVLARNDHYWGIPSKLDAVQFGVEPSAYSTGELENAADPGGLFGRGSIDAQHVLSNETLKREYARIRDATGATIEQIDSPPYTLFLVFDTTIPPFDDLHFRRALVHSAHLNEVFNVPIRWQRRIVPPRLTDYERSIEWLPENDELAAAELKRSPYADTLGNFGFVMYTDGTTRHLDRLERLFGAWNEKLGFRIEIEFVQSLDDVQELIEHQPFPITQFEIEPTYPDPHAVISIFDSAPDELDSRGATDHSFSTKLQAAKTEIDPSIRRSPLR